ncbi:MAG: hypothetical protein QM488_03665 [Rhizobiaceae bacterium]
MTRSGLRKRGALTPVALRSRLWRGGYGEHWQGNFPARAENI